MPRLHLSIVWLLWLAVSSAAFQPHWGLPRTAPTSWTSLLRASDEVLGAEERVLAQATIRTAETNEPQLILTTPTESIQSNPLLVLRSRPAAVFQPWSGWQLRGRLQAAARKLRGWLQKPSLQFRLLVGLAVSVGLSLGPRWFPKTGSAWKLVQRWVAHRGFQGIAALGRAVAYAWALLVAYPKVLDRRQLDQNQKEEQRTRDRRRKRLSVLAQKVSRSAEKVAGLDAEIRAFRREIISIRAAATANSRETGDSGLDPDVREAIASEMAHLARLRDDAQAALVAARQAWSQARAASPDDDRDHEDSDDLANDPLVLPAPRR